MLSEGVDDTLSSWSTSAVDYATRTSFDKNKAYQIWCVSRTDKQSVRRALGQSQCGPQARQTGQTLKHLYAKRAGYLPAILPWLAHSYLIRKQVWTPTDEGGWSSNAVANRSPGCCRCKPVITEISNLTLQAIISELSLFFLSQHFGKLSFGGESLEKKWLTPPNSVLKFSKDFASENSDKALASWVNGVFGWNWSQNEN